MDYKKRQGNRKLKVSLLEVRKMDIFEDIEQPQVVYHMTNRSNLDEILECGKIKSFNDYMTYFFPDKKFIPLYIQLTNALNGRRYYGTDGKIITAPPLIIEDTVVLKLIPKRNEKLEWYREVMKNDINVYKHMPENIKKLRDEFDKCRIAHYGDFQFRDNVEVISLQSVYDDLSEEMVNFMNELDGLQNNP